MGQPGSHRRVKAKCPWHRKCEKTCAFSVDYGRRSGLGDQEPYAFLGAWIVAGARWGKEDWRQHRQYKPSKAEVQEYARAVMGVEPAQESGPSRGRGRGGRGKRGR